MSTAHLINLDKNRKNYSSLQEAFNDVGCSIIRKICEEKLAQYTIKQRCSRILHKLNDQQKAVIDGSKNFGFQYFDFELLYTLFTEHIIDIEPPTRGWGYNDPPRMEQNTIGDDVERMMYIHSIVNSPGRNKSIREEEFSSLWRILEDVTTRFDKSNNTNYSDELDMMKAKKGETGGEIQNVVDFQFRHPDMALRMIRRDVQVSRKSVRPQSENARQIKLYSKAEYVRYKRYSTGSIDADIPRDGKKNSESISQTLRPFKVYMEFPPTELNNYDFIKSELGMVKQRANDEFDLRMDIEILPADLIMFHKSKEDVNKFCLKYFDSIPEVHEMQWSELNQRKSAIHQGKDIYKTSPEIEKSSSRGVMVCVVDESVDHKMCRDYLEPIEKYVRDHRNIIFLFASRHGIKDKKSLAENLGRWLLSSVVIREQNVWHVDDPGAMTIIYQAFYDHLMNSIDRFLETLYSAKSETKCKEILEEMQKQVLQLREECNSSFIKDTKSISEDLQKILVNMSEEGVHAYTMQNDTLRIIVERKRLNRVKRQYQDKIRKYTKVEFVPFDDQKVIITPHYKPGEQLYIEKDNTQRYGTLGIFGKLEKTGDVVAVTGAHVITEGMSAFVSPEGNARRQTLDLGPCIYSPRGDQPFQVNISDIAVIRVNPYILKKIERECHHVNVEIFNGSRDKLLRQRVFKIGATSKDTQGFIKNPDLAVEVGGKWVQMILVKGIGHNKFSEPGDSGSIVFMKRGEKYIAIAVVFGSELNLPEIDKDLAVVVRLDDAIETFNQTFSENLQIHRF